MVQTKLKRELGSKHDSSDAEYASKQTQLVAIWKALVVHFSENLSRLFGFPNGGLRFPQKTGIREIASFFSNCEEAIYILSNVTKPMAYGIHRLSILQSFLHELKDYMRKSLKSILTHHHKCSSLALTILKEKNG